MSRKKRGKARGSGRASWGERGGGAAGAGCPRPRHPCAPALPSGLRRLGQVGRAAPHPVHLLGGVDEQEEEGEGARERKSVVGGEGGRRGGRRLPSPAAPLRPRSSERAPPARSGRPRGAAPGAPARRC